MATLAELLAAKKQSVVPGAVPGILGTPPTLPQVSADDSRLLAKFQSLSKAKTGTPRNRLPLGTGWFLLKHGQYKKTERKGTELTVFSMYCLKGTKDAMGLAPTANSYSGPKAGELYEVALFQEGDYKDSTNLRVVSVCMGWSKEYVTNLQKFLETAPKKDDPTIMELNDIFSNTIGIDLLDRPSPNICMFSNQIVVELETVKSEEKEQKGKDGQPLFTQVNGQLQKVMSSYINTYWQKRISLDKVVSEVPEADIMKAFGSAEAFMAAYEAEKAFNLPA